MITQDTIDYLELDQLSDEQLFNNQKEHKRRELHNIRAIIHNNLHKFNLQGIEYYRDELLQQLDNEINEMDFYGSYTTNTYAEMEYKEFLKGYKGDLFEMFNEFLCSEV